MLSDFLSRTTQWAEEHPDIVGLALVGSNARNAAGPDSDIDLSILCKDPDGLLLITRWITLFGQAREIYLEDYGPTRSLRVFYKDGLEVEFGIADPSWVSLPLDPGTRGVLADGARVLYDPLGLLNEAVGAAQDDKRNHRE